MILTNFDSALGLAIRDARLDAGYTQEEVARALDLSSGTIARYELGTRRIPVSTLLQIAIALKQPLSQLVPGAERLELTRTTSTPASLQQAIQTVVHVLEQHPALAPRVLQVLEESLATEQGGHIELVEW